MFVFNLGNVAEMLVTMALVWITTLIVKFLYSGLVTKASPRAVRRPIESDEHDDYTPSSSYTLPPPKSRDNLTAENESVSEGPRRVPLVRHKRGYRGPRAVLLLDGKLDLVTRGW